MKKELSQEEIEKLEQKKKKKLKKKKEKFEKKLTDNKTGDNFYPFYTASLNFKKGALYSFYFAIICLATNYLSKFLYDIEQIRRWTRGFYEFINQYLAPYLDLLVLLPLVLYILYLLSMIMRMHYGEEQPFKDDRLAKRIKHSFVKEQLCVDFTLAERMNGGKGATWSNSHGENDALSDKNSTQYKESEAERVIQRMSVEVHTRKEVGGTKFYRTAVVKFEKQKNKDIDSRVQSLLSDAINQLQIASDSEFIFRELPDHKQYFYRFLATPKDLTSVYQAKIDKFIERKDKLEGKEKSDEKEIKSQYAFPLEILANKDNDDEERLAKIADWAKARQMEIDSLLVSNSTFVEMLSQDVGVASLNIVYKIGDFKKATSAHALSDQLSNFLGIESITVTLSAGKLSISIPIPQSMRLKTDMSRLFQQAFGPDERKPKEED